MVSVADVTIFNYIFDTEKEKMYVIDPGRYKVSKINDILNVNMKQLRALIEMLLYLDFIKYKPTNSKRKMQMLRDFIKQDANNMLYSNYFSESLKDYENVHEYAKTLSKYIR